MSGLGASWAQIIQFNLVPEFKYIAIALLPVTILRLLMQFKLNIAFESLVYKIEILIISCFKVLCLVASELVAFVVLCMMVNTQNDHSVSRSINLLL